MVCSNKQTELFYYILRSIIYEFPLRLQETAKQEGNKIGKKFLHVCNLKKVYDVGRRNVVVVSY